MHFVISRFRDLAIGPPQFAPKIRARPNGRMKTVYVCLQPFAHRSTIAIAGSP